MRKLLYGLLAAGVILSSCGFVLAEGQPGAAKAQYPAKVDLSDSTGTIRGVAGQAQAAVPAAELVPAEKAVPARETVPAVKLVPAKPVPVTAESLN